MPSASCAVPSVSWLTAEARSAMPSVISPVSGRSTTDEYGSAAICTPSIEKSLTCAFSVKSPSWPGSAVNATVQSCPALAMVAPSACTSKLSWPLSVNVICSMKLS